ncbi:hypothetical protein [Arthrobacter sp. MA-N2]|uniref:hypothetical protein n=1 Tax=Arthrobacter sp. MA-N2 TaxID=1101188 RepID=UPI0004B901E2|nr:hypothetical protein [Arthrobacter sp. MA-N2]
MSCNDGSWIFADAGRHVVHPGDPLVEENDDQDVDRERISSYPVSGIVAMR